MCYTSKQIDNRIQKLIDLEAKRAEIESQIKAIEADLQTDMGDREEVATSHYKITWKTIISNRFDSKAFKVAHEKLYTQFLKPSTSKRFQYREVQS